MFAAWKLSLRRRKYASTTINHFLQAVRSIYAFAEEAEIINTAPKLKRVRNEPNGCSREQQLYTTEQLRSLLSSAKLQVRVMIHLALNCGFGPKDLQDLTWDHIEGDRVTLPRSKTGISRTYPLWPETHRALDGLWQKRAALVDRPAKRGRERSDNGHVFTTKYWRPWNKDAPSR